MEAADYDDADDVVVVVVVVVVAAAVDDFGMKHVAAAYAAEKIAGEEQKMQRLVDPAEMNAAAAGFSKNNYRSRWLMEEDLDASFLVHLHLLYLRCQRIVTIQRCKQWLVDSAMEYCLRRSMLASDSVVVGAAVVAVGAVALVFSLLPPFSWLPQFVSSVLLLFSSLLQAVFAHIPAVV